MLLSSFFQRDVLSVAKDLIGKILCTSIDGHLTKGMITETEAYSYKEKGCHGYQNRKTKRNQSTFEKGGVSYVYLCYGLHHLFNIVTGREGHSEAVLIRSLQPVEGIDIMQKRRANKVPTQITTGPGKLCSAMGLTLQHNSCSVMGNKIWVEEGSQCALYSSKRIGIDYAGQDALLPWRFVAKNNKWVSQP